MLVLPAELTQREAVACLAMLREVARAEQGPDWVLDAGNLDTFDSSALAVLLELRRDALRAGRRLVLRAMPARLRELAHLYGVAVLLESESGAGVSAGA